MNDIREINWGFNCLTAGVHHGRPEAIWNIPLLYAVQIYPREVLKDIVLFRIHNDARQIAAHNDDYDEAWADRVRKFAGENYENTLQHKVNEIDHYYKSTSFQVDAEGIAARVGRDKLNPGYAPLHNHDTINMLCRIVGVSASREASQ